MILKNTGDRSPRNFLRDFRCGADGTFAMALVKRAYWLLGQICNPIMLQT